MISEFIASWPLFQNTYLAGWLVAALLGFVGVFLIAREQMFLGAAISQTSLLGVALALTLGLPDAAARLMAVLLAMGAAVLAGVKSRKQGSGGEALTVWFFVASAGGAILLVANSPLGMEEVQRLLASSLIGAEGADLLLLGIFLLASTVFVGLRARRVILVSTDPVTASVIGINTGAWFAALYAWLGLCIGTSIRVSGFLYAFACLVLPALIVRHWCREIRPMLWMAPLVAVLSAALSFVVANHFDYPLAPTAVVCLSLLFPVSVVTQRR